MAARYAARLTVDDDSSPTSTCEAIFWRYRGTVKRNVGPDASAQLGECRRLGRQPRAAIGLELGERGDALVAIREQRARVHDEDPLEPRTVGAHGERLVERLLILGDHEARAGVAQQVAELSRRAGRIDADGNTAGGLDGEVGDRPLGARVAHDGDRVARAQ